MRQETLALIEAALDAAGAEGLARTAAAEELTQLVERAAAIEAGELRAALEALAGSYVTNKVPHDNLWNMLVRTEVLERARAALAASEGRGE